MPLVLYRVDGVPELPEVETIRRGLERRIVGARVRDVDVHDGRLRIAVDRASLRRLRDQRVAEVTRRAKYLVVGFEEDVALILHLGMSGRVLLVQRGLSRQPHVHVVWSLEYPDLRDPEELHYRDPRRFGMIVTARRSELANHPLLARLGPEPLDERTKAEYLVDRARGTRRSIKTFLMDATVIAGIGNIYASEALWRARIHPRTRAGRISLARWRRLLASVRQVLHAAIEAGGTTLNDFRGEDGNLGYFAADLMAYGRDGEGCRTCGRQIRKIEIGGRSTYYCSRCQRI